MADMQSPAGEAGAATAFGLCATGGLAWVIAAGIADQGQPLTDRQFCALLRRSEAALPAADPVLAAIPIVLVSGAQGRIARSRTDLFDHVLDKPYALERLIDVAEALCGGASAEPTMLSAGPRPLV